METGHILVVDDEKNILSSLEGILSDEGFRVSKAGDGVQALKIIKTSAPDLVMLDIWIPGMDGIQALKAIKEINSDVEVVMMSGHGSIETAVKATKLGAFDFIEKPLSMENILTVVREAIDKKRGGNSSKFVVNSSQGNGKKSISDLSHLTKKRVIRKEKRAISEGKIEQRTLKQSVVLCGHGLHSGLKSGLILSPLPPNSGILFGDISSGDTIPAHVDYVQSTQYATSLKRGSSSVKTIEHIMAALHMYKITNLLIKMGDEVPIMDGSAVDFCQLIEDGKIEGQGGEMEEIIINKPISIDGRGEGERIMIEPSDVFTVNYYMDYQEPVGIQEYEFKYKSPRSFKKNIAPARTFGFVKDVESLEEMGLASGGKLSNIILIDEEKVINTPLRFKDEFVRHKILDIIGDFYLLGRPIRGRINARMTGHSENVLLVKKIREKLGKKLNLTPAANFSTTEKH